MVRRCQARYCSVYGSALGHTMRMLHTITYATTQFEKFEAATGSYRSQPPAAPRGCAFSGAEPRRSRCCSDVLTAQLYSIVLNCAQLCSMCAHPLQGAKKIKKAYKSAENTSPSWRINHVIWAGSGLRQRSPPTFHWRTSADMEVG